MFRHNVQAATSVSGLVAIQALSLNASQERTSGYGRPAQEARPALAAIAACPFPQARASA